MLVAPFLPPYTPPPDPAVTPSPPGFAFVQLTGGACRYQFVSDGCGSCYTTATASSRLECEQACTASSQCVAYESDFSSYCELWHVVPLFSSSNASYTCRVKAFPPPLLPPPPAPPYLPAPVVDFRSSVVSATLAPTGSDLWLRNCPAAKCYDGDISATAQQSCGQSSTNLCHTAYSHQVHAASGDS